MHCFKCNATVLQTHSLQKPFRKAVYLLNDFMTLPLQEKFLEKKSDLIDVDRDSLLKVLQLYNSDLTSIQCDIDAIKKWLKTQPHLPEIPGKLLF